MGSVRLEMVKKVYEGGAIAVDNISFEVQDKEFVVLVGPSGCGKSTTLRMIAGLEEISEGMIYIDGQPVNDVPPKDRDIAMVFQNYALYPHMTVYNNIGFGLKIRGFSKIDIDRRVQEAAEILGIEDFLNRKPKELSGGQRQRVAVGRAIVRKPKVFLFDEPLSNLDAKLRVQMRTEISKLHRRLEATIIYVTHDQTEAMTMGDRIVVMKDGHVLQIDEPLNVYNRPENRFVAEFIGSPAMNFFEGIIRKTRGLVFHSSGDGIKLLVSKRDEKRLGGYVGKEIVLGIRPEHIDFKTRHSGGTCIHAKVEVVEPMGNELYVYFAVPKVEGQFVARMEPSRNVVVGRTAEFVADMSKVHFFNKATGKAV
jgi:multiple sugar transport system ATP-binding protein